MPIRRAGFAIVVALIASTADAHAQHPATQPDSVPAQIHRTLRAFYFNLAHHDWEALTSDILAAKVVAHRPAPEALVTATHTRRAHSNGSSSPAADPVRCSSTAALVHQAAITLEDEWAEVTVPRCTAASAGFDEFRLINFEERWRIVYIELFQDPINVSADR
jgi:hypothetical protein